jgi:hypothetical protein
LKKYNYKDMDGMIGKSITFSEKVDHKEITSDAVIMDKFMSYDTAAYLCVRPDGRATCVSPFNILTITNKK